MPKKTELFRLKRPDWDEPRYAAIPPEEHEAVNRFWDETSGRVLGLRDRMVKELETGAQDLGILKKGKPFPQDKIRELEHKIIVGLYNWALRQMGSNLEKYLKEGERVFWGGFFLQLWMLEEDSNGLDSHKRREIFWHAVDGAQFLMPLRLRPDLRFIHYTDWPKMYLEYLKTDERLREIPLATRKMRQSYLLALKEKLPGVPDPKLKKFLDTTRRPSDIAVQYVCWKFKLSASSPTLKRYFRSFHKPYGYVDVLLKEMKKSLPGNQS